MEQDSAPRPVRPVAPRDHCLGSPEASTALVEYGDYEDPACALAEPEVQRVVKELGDRLCFAFRNFPMSDRHPNARAAAEAAEAADMQGHFWLMHNRLILRQGVLDAASIREVARSIPLDMHEFERDLTSGEPARRVTEDWESGQRHGVRQTPTFFVNGQLYRGVPDFLPLLKAVTGEP